MKIVSLLKSEFYKIRHTSFLNIHLFAALAGILIFLLYFSIYQNVDEYKKIKLLLEFTTIVCPLLISIALPYRFTYSYIIIKNIITFFKWINHNLYDVYNILFHY